MKSINERAAVLALIMTVTRGELKRRLGLTKETPGRFNQFFDGLVSAGWLEPIAGTRRFRLTREGARLGYKQSRLNDPNLRRTLKALIKERRSRKAVPEFVQLANVLAERDLRLAHRILRQ